VAQNPLSLAELRDENSAWHYGRPFDLQVINDQKYL
jgi:hypothetical protein